MQETLYNLCGWDTVGHLRALVTVLCTLVATFVGPTSRDNLDTHFCEDIFVGDIFLGHSVELIRAACFFA